MIEVFSPKLTKNIDQVFIENRPLSPSSMKQFSKSPKHYLAYLDKTFIQSDAMRLGTLIDCLVLEPEHFESRFEIFKKATGTGSQAINKESKIASAKAKMTAITQEEYDTAKTCKAALMDYDQSRNLIEHRTKVQIELEWRDKKNNLPLIGYTDFESTAWGEDIVVDLKSARSSDPNDFMRDAANMLYQVQTGSYLDGYQKIHYRFPTFIFLVVETSPPFNVSVMIADSKYTKAAKEEWHGILKAFRFCMDNKHFDMGYEFRLFGTKDYFNMKIPKYYNPSYPHGFEEEEG